MKASSVLDHWCSFTACRPSPSVGGDNQQPATISNRDRPISSSKTSRTRSFVTLLTEVLERNPGIAELAGPDGGGRFPIDRGTKTPRSDGGGHGVCAAAGDPGRTAAFFGAPQPASSRVAASAASPRRRRISSARPSPPRSRFSVSNSSARRADWSPNWAISTRPGG